MVAEVAVWRDLLIAVVGGLVSTGAWVYVAQLRRDRRLKDVFGPLGGVYSITEKLKDAPRITDSITITVTRNVLHVAYSMAGGDAVGQIVMDERLPTSGRGLYWHDKNGKLLWGFWDVQTKADEPWLLVHTTFAKAETKALVAEGFIWKRTGPAES